MSSNAGTRLRFPRTVVPAAMAAALLGLLSATADSSGGPTVAPGALRGDPASSIEWIDYSFEPSPGSGATQLVITMVVAGFESLPESGTWRVAFTPAIPGSRLDTHQRLWVGARVAGSDVPAFEFGTATASSRGLRYVTRGLASFGAFDPMRGTVTVAVDVGALNAVAAKGLHIRPGGELYGLTGYSVDEAAARPAQAIRTASATTRTP